MGDAGGDGEALKAAFAAYARGKLAAAERLCRAAAASRPDLFDAWDLLGAIHARRSEHEGALACYERALALRPEDPRALGNRGAALYALGRFEEALASAERLVALRPGESASHFSLGTALQASRRHAEAVASFDRALALHPGHVEANYNRAAALVELGRLDAALAGFHAALASRPDHPHALSAAADCAAQSCDWARRPEFVARLTAEAAWGRAIVSPFVLLGHVDDPALQRRCAERWAAATLPSRPPLWTGVPRRREKLRIAYLSQDFREHATAYLIAGLIERHDRSRFEIIGVSYGLDDGSATRRRLIGAFDAFHDVGGLDDLAIARRLHREGVDIAVDLAGHVGGARLGVLSHRPAPIQAGYLGFPGALGAEFIDYAIADATVVPHGHERFFREKIARLPGAYQVNDAARKIGEATPARAEAGLPERGFVFAAFNNFWKITPEVFDIWMRLLLDIDGSVLWLLAGAGFAEARLRAEARARGVDPARLVFAPRLPLERHLARHRLADLVLDTWPCNAHTSASDALWAGVPLVTRIGNAFAGRVAASLLRAIGMPDLVTGTPAGYEGLARALARDPGRLRRVRDRLARNRLTTPLFDTDRFRRNIERAYIQMWDIALRGEAPGSFDVADG